MLAGAIVSGGDDAALTPARSTPPGGVSGRAVGSGAFGSGAFGSGAFGSGASTSADFCMTVVQRSARFGRAGQSDR